MVWRDRSENGVCCRCFSAPVARDREPAAIATPEFAPAPVQQQFRLRKGRGNR